MRQITLASQGSFEKYGRKSKRELFLETMDSIVAWQELEALIEPDYPKAGNGRQPCGSFDHAANLLSSAVVQPVELGSGRCAVRVAAGTKVVSRVFRTFDLRWESGRLLG